MYIFWPPEAANAQNLDQLSGNLIRIPKLTFFTISGVWSRKPPPSSKIWDFSKILNFGRFWGILSAGRLRRPENLLLFSPQIRWFSKEICLRISKFSRLRRAENRSLECISECKTGQERAAGARKNRGLWTISKGKMVSGRAAGAKKIGVFVDF